MLPSWLIAYEREYARVLQQLALDFLRQGGRFDRISDRRLSLGAQSLKDFSSPSIDVVVRSTKVEYRVSTFERSHGQLPGLDGKLTAILNSPLWRGH